MLTKTRNLAVTNILMIELLHEISQRYEENHDRFKLSLIDSKGGTHATCGNLQGWMAFISGSSSSGFNCLNWPVNTSNPF